MPSSLRWALVIAAVSATACGDDTGGTGGGGTGGDPGSGGATGATTSATGATGATSATGSAGSGGGDGEGGQASTGEWTTLITGAWELETGGEDPHAVYTAVADREIFVGAVRPIAPLGTHHTVLSLGGLGPENYIYASGVETGELRFPEGVALRIPEGENLILNLHVYNPTGEVLSDVSGIEIIEIAPEDVVHEADLYLPGPLDLSIEPNTVTTESSTCVVDAEQTIFALFPHMHQLGQHFKTTVTRGDEVIVLHDDDYEFDHQPFYAIDPITLQPGDGITTECTWNNTTSETVRWGESSDEEMCFSIVLRYPKQDGGQGFCP
jgi:hypothetical protein